MKKIIKDHFDLALKTLINTKEEINKIKIISEKLVSKINSNKNIFVFEGGGQILKFSTFLLLLNQITPLQFKKCIKLYFIQSVVI